MTHRSTYRADVCYWSDRHAYAGATVLRDRLFLQLPVARAIPYNVRNPTCQSSM